MSFRKRSHTSKASTERATLMLQKMEDMLSNFLSHKDLPGWYRGKSWFQTDAADRLHNAIRDDAQQGSAHRVQGILNEIGVYPLTSQKNLKLLMRLSRGNDLAFLWFLMEAYYKTPGSSYSVNEQLIMSTIAHLDMVTTLRELDRILPPGNPSKKELEKQRRAREKQEWEAKRERSNKRCKGMPPGLPYFHMQRRVQPRHSSFRSKTPNLKIGLDIYGIYKNPNYEVRNEATRWYASYTLSPANRMANRLLNEEIQMLFGDADEEATKDIAGNLIQSRLKSMFRDIKASMNIVDTHKSLCSKHTNEMLEKREKIKEKIIEKRAECLRHFNIFTYKEKTRIKRLVGDLDKDVDLYRVKYHDRVKKECEPNTSCVLVVGKEKICEREIPDSEADNCQKPIPLPVEENVEIKETPAPEENRPSRLSGGAEKGEKDTCMHNKEDLTTLATDETHSFRLTGGAEKDKEKIYTNRLGLSTEPKIYQLPRVRRTTKRHKKKTRIRNKNAVKGTAEEDRLSGGTAKHSKKIVVSKMDLLTDMTKIDEEKAPSFTARKKKIRIKKLTPQELANEKLNSEKTFQLGHINATTPPSSQMYFVRPTDHKPYHFDYQKIFHFKSNGEDNLRIREACVAALDADCRQAKKTMDQTPDIEQLAMDCANQTWTRRLDKYDDELEQAELENPKDGSTKKLHSDDSNPPCPGAKNEMMKGIPKLSFYDCEDKELMHTMLKSALHIMAKDPKYVLASMEDAYKLPLLREWIYQRYGKTYTAEDRAKLSKISRKIFKALMTVEFNVAVPKTNALGKFLSVDYSCRNYMLKKTQMLKKQFYERYNAEIMRIARAFWFAMFPHLYAVTPPKTTYFSYMPPHVMAIHHFRPWKPDECKDAKSVWDRRRRDNLEKQTT